MKVICWCKQCKYYDDHECGIVKDGLNYLEINKLGGCSTMVYKEGDEENDSKGD